MEQKVLVEIRALERLNEVHLAQALNYLEAFSILDVFL